MIAFGGPEVCGACRTMMHGPREDCPSPWPRLACDACSGTGSASIGHSCLVCGGSGEAGSPVREIPSL